MRSKKKTSRRPRSQHAPSSSATADEAAATGRVLVLPDRPKGATAAPERLPLLPLRSDVVFPQTVVPLVVNRPSGIRLIDDVLAGDKMIGLVSQRHPEIDEPGDGRPLPDDLRRVGPEDAEVPRRLDPDRLPGAVTGPACVESVQTEPYLVGQIEPLEDVVEEGVELDALVHHVNRLFQRMVDQSQQIPEELQVAAMNTREPGRLADLLGSSLPFTIEEKQKLLGEINVRARLERLGQYLVAAARRARAVEQDPGAGRLRDHQGPARPLPPPADQGDPGGAGRERGARTPSSTSSGSGSRRPSPPHEVLHEAEREIERLAGMHPSSAEYSIVRTYLDWLAVLPWTQVEPRPARPPPGPQGPRRRPLRPGEDQGADPRIPGRPQAQEGHEGPDPLLRRPARHGQDVAGQEHRQGAGTRVRPGQPGRRPRRGRDPRPPPHLRRRDARPDHPGHPQGGDQQPGLHARRGRQARRRLPGRPLRGAPGSARPRAELDVPRPLPRRRFRPLEGDVHRHGEHARDDPAPAARPDGGAPAPRLQRGGEDADRPEVHHPQAARAARPDGQGRDVRRRRRSARSSPTTPARRACGTSSARSRRSAARSPASTPRARTNGDDGRPRRWCPSCSARRGSSARWPTGPGSPASPPGWPGPRPAARSSSSRRPACPARGR